MVVVAIRKKAYFRHLLMLFMEGQEKGILNLCSLDLIILVSLAQQLFLGDVHGYWNISHFF